jgi:transcriptional regulator, ArsR family
MNLDEIFKVLNNKNRLEYLEWLKDPQTLFPEQQEPFETGVCVGQIQKKSGKTLSTVSEHLSILHGAGLVISTKKGKWIYYKRNEDQIAKVIDTVKNKL